MLQSIISMFNHLEGVQKMLFIFWLLCVSMFIISLINLIVYGIKSKLNFYKM
jgi:hypothetical protein